MAWLPLANILHHKLRSVLSALGIGIGICMLVTLSGLSRGTLSEVADRWDAVDAQLIVYPLGWGENVTTLSGIGVSDRYARKIVEDCNDIVQRVVPVFLWQMKMGGQDQLASGVDREDWATLTGGRELKEGRLFDPNAAFARWIEQRLLTQSDGDETVQITPEQLQDPNHNGLEMVIDTRLARKGHLTLGQQVEVANHRWTIVGIVPEGGMSRVYLPRRTAQFLFGSGMITKSTLMFVKLREGVNADDAARRIRKIGQEVVQLRQYRAMLEQKFGVLYKYVDAVNVVALVISFLFIMVTLYTMVLQRTREIAILKSCGASNAYIWGQVLAESGILTGAGAIVGVAISLLAGWLIGALTLYTVLITWHWIAVAVAAAVAGALASAAYPAWRATSVDMVEALTFE